MSNSNTTQQLLPAVYFGGQALKGEAVLVEHHNGQLLFALNHTEHSVPVQSIRREETFGNAPVVLKLPCGGTLEFDQATCMHTLKNWRVLSETGFEKLLRKPLHWVGASATALLLAFVIYMHGLPTASSWVATTLPQSALNHLFDDLLPLLDQHLFKPSQLPVAKRQLHRAELAKLMAKHPELSHVKLEFRSHPAGPNAFALPNGTIVLGDELEELLTPAAVAGVLAHEIGHIHLRHSAIQLIQNTAVGTLIIAFTGDVSLMLAGVISQLATMHYSREFELAADQFAIDLFISQGRNLAHLEELHKVLEKLDEADAQASSYLSSHPAAEERIKLIQQHAGKQQ